MPRATKSPSVNVWRYSIPSVNYEGWAILFLDSAGCFAALSDYGDWSYRWNSRGIPEGLDFRAFLLECEDEYILRKIAPTQEWDGDATLQSTRDLILGMRRDGGWSKEDAREEWDALEHYEGFHSEYNFWDWSRSTKISDTTELACYQYSRQAKAFLEKCWPKLKDLIREDLA